MLEAGEILLRGSWLKHLRRAKITWEKWNLSDVRTSMAPGLKTAFRIVIEGTKKPDGTMMNVSSSRRAEITNEWKSIRIERPEVTTLKKIKNLFWSEGYFSSVRALAWTSAKNCLTLFAEAHAKTLSDEGKYAFLTLTSKLRWRSALLMDLSRMVLILSHFSCLVRRPHGTLFSNLILCE